MTRRHRVLITADCGGSNSSRTHLWLWELQQLADQDGMIFRGVPLPARNEQVEQDRASAVLPHHAELAGHAAGDLRGRRESDWFDDYGWGLEVHAWLDGKSYEKGRKIYR